MFTNIEPLLLNVLFLLTFLIFIPMLVERSHDKFSEKQKYWTKVSASFIAIVSCMSFPLILQEGFVFDLRNVAVIISSMYGGIPAAFFAWLVVNAYRLYLGGYGFYSNLMISTFVLISCLFLYPKFHHGSKNRKLLITSLFSTVLGLLVIVVLSLFFSVSISFFIGFIYLLILVITTVGSVYVIEILREDASLKRRVVKAEKMEVVSHLASSISHEVRNPLAVVKGFLQLMDKTELPREKQREFINLSINEINRANDIIKNYLTFAKPALENVRMVDIKEELQTTIEMITPLANMNCVAIESRLDTYMINGDPQLLQQSFLNITKNCIEAMPNSGRLIINTLQGDNEVVVKIADNGKGMSEQQLARIGEPYFTTKGREGTGLGMMVVFQIIEMLKGKITVTSKLDEGTTFLIRFPLANLGRKVPSTQE
ncbi:hypothetical protein BKP35_00900 [Anaerobacillus arseniciselenatis]|uniref:histidine kinase n=1 Tax=Anaerobacillus arseniciselenatis TaxID=85682 RepID=A0A1S2LTV8_9BACI|nr:ATP-binding protein [Anaerobacillus arseniciselenatis]OIJ15583.1 hypothetical protein BKP35_00900 [Anaerobacillus arseniciselenatis]